MITWHLSQQLFQQLFFLSECKVFLYFGSKPTLVMCLGVIYNISFTHHASIILQNVSDVGLSYDSLWPTFPISTKSFIWKQYIYITVFEYQ